MSKIVLQIDGRDVEAEAGMTVLEAARSAGISIPTSASSKQKFVARWVSSLPAFTRLNRAWK
jgi:hypothetical protein